MRSPNLQLGKRRHLNISLRHLPESPLFFLPSFYWLPKHDVNLEIEGVSLGLCFGHWVAQLNIRRQSWVKHPSQVDLVRANGLAGQLTAFGAGAPDAVTLVKTFERHRWLRELTSRGVETTHYGLRILREAAHETSRKDSTPASSSAPLPRIDLKIEGLE